MPTFCWRWGQCISVTAGGSAGYQLIARGLIEVWTPMGFPDSLATHIVVLPPKFTAVQSLDARFPLLLQSSHPHRVGGRTGLAFVCSWLCSHSPGYTVMFSSVVWRIPLFLSWLEDSEWETDKKTINKHNLTNRNTKLICLKPGIMNSMSSAWKCHSTQSACFTYLNLVRCLLFIINSG